MEEVITTCTIKSGMSSQVTKVKEEKEEGEVTTIHLCLHSNLLSLHVHTFLHVYTFYIYVLYSSNV